QGSFDITTGSVFVFDNSPVIKNHSNYSDLSCPDPNDYPANCGYGNEADFQNEPIYEFFNSGGYSISASGPLTIFGFSGTVELSVPDDGDSYQWYKDGAAITGANSNIYLATETGNYYVELTFGATVLTTPSITFSYLNPELWLKGDAGISVSGSDVTQWDDNSENAFTASQPASSTRPVYFNNGNDHNFNFKPYISFNGSSDRLALDNSYNSKDFDQVYVFSVFKTDESVGGGFDNWAFIDYDRSEFFNSYVRADNGYLGFSYNGSSVNDAEGTTPVNDDQPHISLTLYDNSNIDDEQIFVDGRLELSYDREATGYQIGTNSNTRYGFIGDGSEASSFNNGTNNNYYDGELAEIIYFRNRSFDFTELNRIFSYLAVKYGIELNMDDDVSTPAFDERDYHASDNTVIWDYSESAGYNSRVAGIGRDDAMGLNSLKSKSIEPGSTLEIEKTSSIDNDLNFIVWGNNDGEGLNANSPA
ncbi:MAG: hypothetical protein ACP5E3_06490, partial [Bacteroidales bacterium]